METDFNKLLNLVEKQKSVMLTTKQNDGLLKSRPMTISKLEQDGTMWMFNNKNSCKANEIKDHPQVNLNINDESNNEYVSISGTAQLIEDKDKMNELMNSTVKLWFPEGVEDPSISLLKISFEKGAYWVNEESKLKQLFEISKAMIKKERVDLGSHAVVDA